MDNQSRASFWGYEVPEVKLALVAQVLVVSSPDRDRPMDGACASGVFGVACDMTCERSQAPTTTSQR
jgi:hypothetical protein